MGRRLFDITPAVCQWYPVTLQVTSGVPRGSVLWPLLLLLYVNDIIERIEPHIRLLAYDCVLYREIGILRKVFIHRDLAKISDWCTRWSAQLNLNKTVYMNFTGKKLQSQISYPMNNVVISKSNEYKYFGVYFSSHLNWQRHVDYTTGKAGKALGFLRRNAKYFIMPTKELLHKTYVRSVLDYGPATVV